MKVIENLTQEQKQLLEDYTALNKSKQEIDKAIELLKPTLMEMFNGEEILDGSNKTKYKFTEVTSQRKTLNMERLLHFISQSDLDSCYDIKEIRSTRITIGEFKD